MSAPENFTAKVSRVECIVAALLALLASGLHLAVLLQGGPLWRDEANTVNLATLPTLRGVWEHLHFDSFPLAWLLVLRGLSALGLSSDGDLRMLGFLVGVAILGALWLNARRLKTSVPLVSLALLGCAPALVLWGDSLRAYGFGCLLILLAFGGLWKVVEAPSAWNVAFATLAAVLSVNALYQNAVLLFAIGAAAMVVAARNHWWQRVAVVAAIGAAAALSLLFYIGPMRRVSEVNLLLQIPEFTLTRFWSRLREPLGIPGDWMVWVWLMTATVMVALVALMQIRPAAVAATDRQRDLALFAGTVLMLSIAGYFVFLKKLSYPTHPWYYLALMAVAAAALDAGTAAIRNIPGARISRLIFVSLVVALAYLPSWRATQSRLTNVDRVAASLKGGARPGDLVVIAEWWCGVSFNRYYKGPATWTTLPPLEDHRLHRFDLIKPFLAAPDQSEAFHPVLNRIGAALRRGDRVWVVTLGDVREAGRYPTVLPPAPHPETGWYESPYLASWATQIGAFLRNRAASSTTVAVADPGWLGQFERLHLERFEGWQEP